MKNLIARFVKDESGATAIEYGLIAAGIALAIITVVNNLGTTLNDKFGSISSSLIEDRLAVDDLRRNSQNRPCPAGRPPR